MADKFIHHGAAFNGDGTTSAVAASNGAAGAWNNIAYLEGTSPVYGSLVNNDVVYIRSLDAAGSPIVRTMVAGVTLGSASATPTANVTWVIDNGVKWPGIDGVITYTSASTYNVTLRVNNILKCLTQDSLVIKSTMTNPGAGALLAHVYGHLIGAKIDWTAKTGSSPAYAVSVYSNGGCLESPTVKWGVLGGSGTDNTRGLLRVYNSGEGSASIINPQIELQDATNGLAVFNIDGSTSANRVDLSVIGGRVYGAGAVSGQYLINYRYASMVRFVGFDVPRAMPIYGGTAPAFSETTLLGCDGGIGGHLERVWGWATSRTDNNPPTLAAYLPDSNSTPWSWRVYPKSADSTKPMMLTTVKLFTDTAAIKTISQEVLVANSMSPTKKSMWLTVEYTDATTGLSKHLSTRDYTGAALDTSTAGWTAAVWGLVTLIKKKLSVTTPTTVKQNTPIIVILWGVDASTTDNDIYFVDPDFGVN